MTWRRATGVLRVTPNVGRSAAPLVAALGLAFTTPAAAAAAAVDSIPELSRAIMKCWKPPAGSRGFEITLRFGLTGRGVLRGPPMVTYSRLFGPEALRQAFALSAFRAVADCTPVALTDAFGRVVAERVLTLHFGASAKAGPAI